ncbi:MAG: hypothetical protein IT207_10360 [Fimbriimonadaceae bacterium]|nr:hypothetical protein [Fimbriimonadaceae bacterium]
MRIGSKVCDDQPKLAKCDVRCGQTSTGFAYGIGSACNLNVHWRTLEIDQPPADGVNYQFSLTASQERALWLDPFVDCPCTSTQILHVPAELACGASLGGKLERGSPAHPFGHKAAQQFVHSRGTLRLVQVSVPGSASAFLLALLKKSPIGVSLNPQVGIVDLQVQLVLSVWMEEVNAMIPTASP